MDNANSPTVKEMQDGLKVGEGEEEKECKKQKVNRAAGKVTGPSTINSPALKQGRWSPHERLLFLHGLKLYGRGRWKLIRHFLPLRSLVQVKSHGQKVLKRADAGEDIWAPLREKPRLVRDLVAKATKSPNFVMPRLPAKASIMPKPKLMPRRSMIWEQGSTEETGVFPSVGCRENEAADAVFRTQFGSTCSQSFSLRNDVPQKVEDEESTTSSSLSNGLSDCQTPRQRPPQMIAPTAVLAATALCQLSVGGGKPKSSADEEHHRLNIVSP